MGGQASSRDISKARSLRSKDDNNDDGFKSCNGDEAGNGETATGVHDNSPVRINRSWYLPPKSDAFMHPRNNNNSVGRAEKRALDLRASKKAELLKSKRKREESKASGSSSIRDDLP